VRAGFGLFGSLATRILGFKTNLDSTCDGLRLTASLSTFADAALGSLSQTGFASHASLPPRDRPQLDV